VVISYRLVVSGYWSSSISFSSSKTTEFGYSLSVRRDARDGLNAVYPPADAGYAFSAIASSRSRDADNLTADPASAEG